MIVRGQNIRRRRKTSVNQEQRGGHQYQIGRDEREKRGAENFEEQGVEVLRKRAAGKIKNVAIKHRTVGQPPRNVKLTAEIHDQIRPATPGNCGGNHKGQRHQREAGPKKTPRENLLRAAVFFWKAVHGNKF